MTTEDRILNYLYRLNAGPGAPEWQMDVMQEILEEERQHRREAIKEMAKNIGSWRKPQPKAWSEDPGSHYALCSEEPYPSKSGNNEVAECWEGCEDPWCPYTHPQPNPEPEAPQVSDVARRNIQRRFEG